MTLEEQLERMAGTSAERQLIRRWLHRDGKSAATDSAADRATIDASPTAESADDAIRPAPLLGPAG